MPSCRHNDPDWRKVYDLHIAANQWVLSNDKSYYFCSFNIPELSTELYNYGVVLCNREYNKGTNNAYQIALPQTIHNVDESTDALYTTTIDYSYMPGLVEIVLTNNDFVYAQPEAMDFRLTLLYEDED